MTEREITAPSVFTIGHSNHAEGVFLELLSRHDIKLLVDVRSRPASRYNPQFNKKNLERALPEAGVEYLHLGKELGGMPPGDEYYDEGGFVLYDRLARSPLFAAGISVLETKSRKIRLAIMCAEENPAACHRLLLIARVLAERGIAVRHIRGDGSVEMDETEAAVTVFRGGTDQGELFRSANNLPWRSAKPVRVRRTHGTVTKDL
jgi:uncharacterized protein (DUF488 family)